MALSPAERRQLREIDADIRQTDPALASVLAMFTRLTDRDDMPEQEQLGSPAGRPETTVLLAATAVTLFAWPARLVSYALAWHRRRARRPRPAAAGAGSREQIPPRPRPRADGSGPDAGRSPAA